jgi:FKBP-type peptidyl-prolyl cis-trans isomerase FkpA
MRLRLVILATAAASLVGCSQAPAPKTDDEKAVYALGAVLAKRSGVEAFDLTDAELALAGAGFADGARDKASISDEELDKLMPKLQELHTKRGEAKLKRTKEEGTAYLTKAAAESGAKKTASGLVYKITQEGTGAQPQATDTVKVHYIGKFIDGKEFDNSHKHQPPGPAQFPLNGVIPCWTEGMQLLKVGSKAQLVCPSDIAYGDQTQPPMRAGATLVFDVELLEIVKPDAAAAAPAASPHGAAPR